MVDYTLIKTRPLPKGVFAQPTKKATFDLPAAAAALWISEWVKGVCFCLPSPARFFFSSPPFQWVHVCRELHYLPPPLPHMDARSQTLAGCWESLILGQKNNFVKNTQTLTRRSQSNFITRFPKAKGGGRRKWQLQLSNQEKLSFMCKGVGVDPWPRNFKFTPAKLKLRLIFYCLIHFIAILLLKGLLLPLWMALGLYCILLFNDKF